MGVKVFENGIALLEDAGAVVSHRSTPRHQAPIGDLISVTIDTPNGGQARIMEWGANNDLPDMRERLVADNNIVPSLLATRRDITLGHGLFAFKERYEREGDRYKRIIDEVPMPAQCSDFFEQVDIDTVLRQAANNLLFHAMIFPEYVRKLGGPVEQLNILQCRHVRAEEMDDSGRINNWYWSGRWGHLRDKSRKGLVPVTKIPAYDPTKKQGKFVMPLGDDLLCIDEYYFTPYWWGDEEWIRLSNCIAPFHQANLNHGYSIRYHIEIPKGYFADQTPVDNTKEGRKKALDAETAARQAFLDRLNKFLSGVTKAGRTVVTEYELNRGAGKEFPGIKITPLKIDLQDEALLKLFEKSNQANISAQGIHPTLANIETQGKLSSGSEIRNAFLMYVAIKTPLPRKTILKILDPVKKFNKWDKDIHFGFRDMELTRLDEEKSGKKETNMINE